MPSLAEYRISEFEKELTAWGFKSSHAARILRRYFDFGGSVPWDALRVPEALRERVTRERPEFASVVSSRQVAADGTVKLLLRYADGRSVEAVMMSDYREDRVAGCLSTQAGCAMGCDFCATAQGGLERNLEAGEIVEQFLRLRGEAKAAGKTLRTVVFMGMGEPMHNYDAMIEALRRIGGGELGALGWRQITVSTVGIVAGIDRLAAEGLRVNLAVSLHAPDDTTRARLLPAGRRFAIADILAAADRYQSVSGLPVIVQYCLLKDVNDSPEQAGMLADLLAARRMHVNLLHYNPTGAGLSGRAYEACPVERMDAFIAILRDRGVVAHVRRPRGRDIAAACGQLRAEGGDGI